MAKEINSTSTITYLAKFYKIGRCGMYHFFFPNPMKGEIGFDRLSI